MRLLNKPGSVRLAQYLTLLLVAGVLAGCASTLSTRVTSFQQWPPDAAGYTYRIVPTTAQRGQLEFQAYADMVAAAMAPTLLVSAAERGETTARFDVTLAYESPVFTTVVRQHGTPWDGWGASLLFGGPYYAWGGWYMPPTVDVPVQYHQNTLTVAIQDRHQDGREVYRATAVHRGADAGQLPRVMPYLAQAIFDGFPGTNGQVREVRLALPR